MSTNLIGEESGIRVLREKFLEGMSNAASTVNVVTTDGPTGLAGLTVSAMSSVSADPPSLLICVNAQSRSAEIINGNGVFCVNVLNDSQSYISTTFSGRHSIEEKFACADWVKSTTGSPVLADALVSFDCVLKNAFKSGSHYIFIGEIANVRVQESGNPLIYARRAYGRAVKIVDKTPPHGSPSTDNGTGFAIGSYVGISPFLLPKLVSGYRRDGYLEPIRLEEGTRQTLLDNVTSGKLDLALMYQYDEFVDAKLDARCLSLVTPYVLLPRAHPLAEQAQVSLVELAKLPMVCPAHPSSGPEFIDSLFEQVGVEPYKAYYAPSFEVLRGLVGNGVGYAITFTDPACKMTYDGAALARVRIAENIQPAKLLMVHKPLAHLNQASSEFISYCSKHFSSLN